MARPPTNWRRNERRTQQPKPPSPPRQLGGVEHCRWSIPGPDGSQALHELKGLLAPSSPRLESNHRHLSPLKSSEYFVSLSSRALVHTAPSTLAAPGCAVPSAANRHRNVMSTQVGLQRTMGVLLQELQWPCRHAPPQPRSCREVLRCTSLSHPPLGTPWPTPSHPERSHAALCRPCRSRRSIRRELLRPAIGVSPRPKCERALPQCRTLALMDRRSTPLNLLIPNENGGGLGRQRTTGSTPRSF